MKKFLSTLVVLAFCSVAAHAADDNKQQTKMATCNKEAGDKKGDERKKFMSDCLKAKPAATAQQTKMKTCNVEAKDKKGDERKKFMSECLKKAA
jgi:hypothetical protein